jgi:two-component system sensor histidine kinase UhpB
MADRCAEVQQDVRKLLGRLRPLGLGGAQEGPVSLTQLAGLIDALVQSWRDTAALGGTTGYQHEVTLAVPGRALERAPTPATDDCWLSRDMALVVYRLTQEALTNCARHAQATQVSVGVSVALQGDQAELRWCVADNGRGLVQPELALRKGNGLGGMQERVWALGGEWAMAFEQGLSLQARFTYMPPPRPATEGAAP